MLVSNVVEYPTASFVLVMAFFAWFGNFIVTHYLIDKQIRNYLSKIVFVITFMCSVGLLAMYLY